MSRSGKFLKASLRVLVIVGVLRSIVENGGRRSVRATGIVTGNHEVAGNMKQDLFEGLDVGKKKHKALELNYLIKRRVPNGPDPIHNRRAGNSHRPPGHT